MEKELKKTEAEQKPQEVNAERPHHPTSPSKLQLIEWCPHYENYEREEQHEMTIRGSAQHDVVETGEIPDDMSDEDAVMAMERRQYIENKIQTLLELHPGNLKMLTEEYYPIDDKPMYDKNGVLFEGTTAGYLDCALVFANETLAEIHDWKFGNWGVEPAHNNLQGIAYALGLVKRFPKLRQVHVFFHIPRVSREPNHHVFSRKELEQQRQRVEAVVSRHLAAKKDKEMRMAHPGYPACAFCGKAAECRALFSKVKQVAHKFGELPVPENIDPLTQLDNEDQEASMKLAHVVQVWAKAFKNRVLDRILEGKAKCPEAFTLVSYTEREVVDPVKLEEVVSKYTTKKAWRELKKSLTPSLTAITKLVRSRAERGKKDAAEEALSDALFEAGALKRTKPVAFLRAKRSTAEKKTETENKE